MKYYRLFFFSLFINYSIQAQRTINFEVRNTAHAQSNSLYNTFELINACVDRSAGFVLQENNWPVNVIFKQPLKGQIENLFIELIDSNAQNGKMVFCLQSIDFAEVRNKNNRLLRFRFGATLFAERDGYYYMLQSIDTNITIESSTINIFEIASNCITQTIIQNLNSINSNPTRYYYADMKRIDSLEKITIPLYKYDTLKDGVYLDYEHFAQQVPNYSAEYTLNNDVLIKVKCQDKKIEPKTIYAVVYKGKAHIVSNNKYRKLYKQGLDFYYKEIGGKSTNAAVGLALVSVPLALTVDGLHQLLEFKIHYKYGYSIYSKVVKGAIMPAD